MSQALAVREPSAHRAGIVGSVVVHVLLLAGMFWVASRASEPPPLVYAVNLVAAPAPAPRRAARRRKPRRRPRRSRHRPNGRARRHP